MDYLEDSGAAHPGGRSGFRSGRGPAPVTAGPNGGSFPYAGGKVMCFLSGPTAEFAAGTSSSGGGDRCYGTGVIGAGGFGGTCAEVGLRYGYIGGEGGVGEPQRERGRARSADAFDPESGLVFDQAGEGGTGVDGAEDDRKNRSGGGGADDGTFAVDPPARPDTAAYLQSVGIRCAESALGVEIFFLLNDAAGGGLVSSRGGGGRSPRLGLSFLRLLSDRSGGNGPLLVDLSAGGDDRREEEPEIGVRDGGSEDWVGGTVPSLIREVKYRCPWGRYVS